jgi:hypothetical protein
LFTYGRNRRRIEGLFSGFFDNILFFYLLQFRFEPCTDALLDNAESGIAVKEDRPDEGFHGIGEDRLFPVPPQSLLPLPEPDIFPDMQTSCDLCKGRVILKPLFLLRDIPLRLDTFFHQEEDQAGLQHGVSQRTVGHLIHAPFILLEQLVGAGRVGKCPYKVLFFKKMIPDDLFDL